MFTWWSWQAGKGCPQTAMVLSTAAFLKMCQGWIVWNFAQEEKYYQWNNQQVKWLQPQAPPVFANFCPGSILPAGRQESWNINVKCEECLGHCCWCTCACSCAFWGQGWALGVFQGKPSVRMELTPAQPAPPSLSSPSAMDAAKQEPNLFSIFFTCILLWSLF